MLSDREAYFRHYFRLLCGGSEPYPWQSELFCGMLDERWPDSIALPTGSGKTAIMQAWLLALGWSLITGRSGLIPRRLAWVVNRRVVVDQATTEAEKIQAALSGLNGSDDLARALQSCSFLGKPLGVSTLRGQKADNREWSRDPLRPSIVIGTVDMIGSRLLFRGYGDRRYNRPKHAGLIGVDTLVVNDEAHLTPAFGKLLTQIRDMAPGRQVGKTFRVLLVSATNRESGDGGFKHDLSVDAAASERFRAVFEARKRVWTHEQADAKGVDSKMMELALAPGAQRILLFIESPEKAAKTATQLETKAPGRVALLTGTMRGHEREALVGSDVFRAFERADEGHDPVWMVATSAAEVGVNISADRLMSGLVTADHLIQRFGRLSRFGAAGADGGGEAHVVFAKPKPSERDEDLRLARTIDYLRSLPAEGGDSHDISCRALAVQPPPRDCASPEPVQARLDERLIDLWSQTSAEAPAIPRPANWLHGKQDDDGPETEVAWRAETAHLCSGDADRSAIAEALDIYRILPHEKLREPSSRVLRKLGEVAALLGDDEDRPAIWIPAEGEPEPTSVRAIAGKRPRDVASGCVVLPPGVGEIANGMWSAGLGKSDSGYDVADEGAASGRRRYLARVEGGTETFTALAGANGAAAPESLAPADVARFARDQGLGKPASVECKSDVDGAGPAEYVLFFPAGRGGQAARWECSLDDHLSACAEAAAKVAAAAGFPELEPAFKRAGRMHDEGKRHCLWQRAMGGNTDSPKAKTTGGGNPRMLAGFRHELASLAAAESGDDDLALHLIASHHGWARPFFRARAYDPTSLDASERAAFEAVRRFGRLQERYGAWGLAYLEALFKAADGIVSESSAGAAHA